MDPLRNGRDASFVNQERREGSQMQLSVQERADHHGHLIENQWPQKPCEEAKAANLWSGIERFKSLLAEADRAALRNNDVLAPTTITDIENTLSDCCGSLVASLEQTSDPEALGAQIRRELLPYLLLTGAAERWYSKPRG